MNISDRPTPETDANTVDLNECISVRTLSSGQQAYVEKYIPSYIARSLEQRLAHAVEALEYYADGVRFGLLGSHTAAFKALRDIAASKEK